MSNTCPKAPQTVLAEDGYSMVLFRQPSPPAAISSNDAHGCDGAANHSDNGDAMNKHFDWGTLVVILTTFFLFVVALFVKGLTKDLLLEAGVLLVSIKLIIMAYKNRILADKITNDLVEIKKMIAAGSVARES